MNINVKIGDLRTEAVDAIVLSVFEGQELISGPQAADEATNGGIRELIDAGDFKGEHKQTSLLYTRGAITAPRIGLVGLGKRADFDIEKARQAVGKIVKELRDLGVNTVAIPFPPESPSEMVEATVEASVLALYEFNQHKTQDLDAVKTLESVTLLVENEASRSAVEDSAGVGETIAKGANLARDLSNQPPNHLTPTLLAEKAQEVASETGLKCEVFDLAQLQEKGFRTLVGVSQGSQEEPRFIILEHTPENEGRDTVVFVGKGITFDSGGLSLKSGSGMMDMKHDMSGAAAVLGAMQAVGQLKPDLHVVGLIAASENLPSGTAQRPGDVVKSYGGKTIEILNTDAEGRLVLADALGYAAHYSPKVVVDLATLTGAVVTALGHFACGMLGTDDDLMGKLRAAAQKTHERVWQLPLWDDYDEMLKSKVADVKNIGDGTAGTIAGAAFLKQFAEDYPWVHLDIAGTAWDVEGSSYIPKGATGYGARLLVQLVRDWAS
ncbi:MAG: leucyl aminopeptidase [Candidatus Poribacteria bacterium]|nr:leucyl aminopeptidase [Candidatus Poribacteria bacterium]